MKYDIILFLLVVLLCILLFGSYLGFFERIVKEGLTNGTKTTALYTAPNGATALVKHGTITVTNPDGTSSIYTVTSTTNTGTGNTQYNASSGVIYYGPDGGTATVIHNSNGSDSISITGPNGGDAVIFESSVDTTTSNTNDNGSTNNNNGTYDNYNGTYDNYNHYIGTSSPTVYYGPNETTARVVGDTLVITNKNGSTEVYNIDNSNNTSNGGVTIYIGPNGGKAVVATDVNGKNTVSITRADGSKIVYFENNVYTYNNTGSGTTNSATTNTNMSGTEYSTAFNTYTGPNNESYNSTGEYNDSLPAGVSRSQIPAGQEDLYILKSEVVPPVCPMCPNIICPEPAFDDTKCGACPPCERISNNDFECKKVPNYNAINSGSSSSSSFLPIPVISDFSGFGM